MGFRIWSAAFEQGGSIPRRHTGDGENLSPALYWEDLPFHTRSLALVCEDPDAPVGTWTHWLVANIDVRLQGLGEGVRLVAPTVEPLNDFGQPGYGGPAPPRGHGRHRYYFRLLAVKEERVELSPAGRRADFERALRGLVLAECATMGVYERR